MFSRISVKVASSTRSPYKVFISHVGEDKTTIAFPLREKLLQYGITAFVDEKDMPGGTWSEQAMITAMETYDIAVVLLSPEFVARKWPMTELLCFIRRSEQAHADGTQLPVIIPLFYRLSIQELYKEPRLNRLDQNGKSLYRATRFFERMGNLEPEANVENIQAALRKLHGVMGVENYVGATNESTSAMLKCRNVLLNDLVQQVLHVVRRLSRETNEDPTGSETEETDFRPHFHGESSVSDLVLDFHERENGGNPTTIEGAVLETVLDRSEDSRLISIQGIGGVGKTSILRGLSSVDKLNQRFSDGTYLLGLGADATENTVIEGISQMVEDSGATKKSDEMRKRKDCKKVFKACRSWFAKKECLFMVDDVWETAQVTSDVIHELLMLNASGPKSKILFTTRSTEIASRAERFFVLEPREPESSQCRSILMLHSRAMIDESNAEDKNAVAEILRRCVGLPLFLKLAGRAIKALSVRHGSEGGVTYRLYLRTLDVSIQGLLNTDVDSYNRLAPSLSVSLRLVDDRKERWGFPVKLSAAEMHRRLSVLAKHSHVPMSMLRHLWEVGSEAEATIVAREFEQIALATLYVEHMTSGDVEFLGVHDSLHEYAIGETRRLGEETLGHKILLAGYGQGLGEEKDCRAWWTGGLEVDGYVHSYVCHHLSLGGCDGELINLLLKPEWTIRCFDVCGILDVERDYALGIKIARRLCKESPGEPDGMNRAFEIATAFEMISDAARMSCGYKARHPRELCFRLYGCLKIYTTESVIIKKYLDRLEENGTQLWGPWLRCVSSFLTCPGGGLRKVSHLDSDVKCMVMSYDGIFVYCGCRNGTVVSVNLKSGEALKFGDCHQSPVDCIVLCNNGKLLCSGSSNRTVKTWNTQTCELWKPRNTFQAPTNQYGQYGEPLLAIGHGRVISYERGTEKLNVWGLETGQLLLKPFMLHDTVGGLDHSEVAVTCIDMFPDGEHVISGGLDKSLRIWNARSGKQVRNAFIGHEAPITCVSVISDGRHIVSGSSDRTVRIWNIEERAQTGNTFIEHQSAVTCVSVSGDGRRVASGAHDGVILVWNVASRQVQNKLKGHTDAVSAVLFHPVVNTVISCSMDGTVRFWDVNNRSKGLMEGTQDRHQSRVICIKFTSDGKYAVSGSRDHSLRIWDANSGRQIGNPLRGHSDVVTDVEVTPDRRRAISISQDKTVRVWDFESHELLHTFTGHTEAVDCVAITRSGDQAVTSSQDGTIRVWDLTMREGGHFVLGKLSAHPLVTDEYTQESKVFATDDGLRVVSVLSCEISLWDLRRRQYVRSVHINKDLYRLTDVTRKYVMELVGEGKVESSKSSGSVLLKGRKLWYICEEENILLGALEAYADRWAISPDKKTICVGLVGGQVVFMKLEI